MEHKTKFKVGEIAWFMHENKAVSKEVRGMKISYQIGWYEGLYSLEKIPIVELELGDSDWSIRYYAQESDCFHSKEELLKSL